MLTPFFQALRLNYLRVRGEYMAGTAMRSALLELPPRARRIPCSILMMVKPQRTTSACAENTHYFWRGKLYPGNYLRVRGEYEKRHKTAGQSMELPPRARRIR